MTTKKTYTTEEARAHIQAFGEAQTILLRQELEAMDKKKQYAKV